MKWSEVKSLSPVLLFVIPWTVVYQAPLSMEFSRQEYWIGLPFPSPRDLPDPGMEPKSLMSPALAGRFFITSAIWEVTKWSREKAKRILSREHTGHSKHPFQQPKRWLYTWTSPDDQYWNQTDYVLCSGRQRRSIQSAKTRPRTDCALDHELLIAKFRFELKKVGKTNRPFKHDLNQSPYDYTVEVTNRVKGSDPVEPGRLQSVGSQRVRHNWSDLAQHCFLLNSKVKLACYSGYLWG